MVCGVMYSLDEAAKQQAASLAFQAGSPLAEFSNPKPDDGAEAQDTEAGKEAEEAPVDSNAPTISAGKHQGTPSETAAIDTAGYGC